MVSYYRDPRNPEAVHFPAQIHVAATHAFILLALIVTVILTLTYRQGADALGELGVVAACLAALSLYYPKKIITDETGVHAGGLLAFRKRLIRWNDINSVRERAAVYGIPPFDTAFIANWIVEIRSISGERPIRFTCRHSGRLAFLRALKRWGAPDPELRHPLRRSA
jgi:hypothetical protein